VAVNLHWPGFVSAERSAQAATLHAVSLSCTACTACTAWQAHGRDDVPLVHAQPGVCSGGAHQLAVLHHAHHCRHSEGLKQLAC